MHRNIVITGASGGIGRAIVRRFAENGDRIVAVAHRHPERLNELCAMYPGRITVVTADLTDRSEIKRLAKAAEETLDGVDILINNAGIARQQLFVDMTDEEWDRLWAADVSAPVLLTRALLPGMLSRGSGQILNVSSMWGERGASCEVAYSAAKAAVIGFTKALAKEVGLMGVRVNCVAPGVIDTEMCAHLSEETKADLAEQTALGRLGSPEDIAGALFLLTEPGASFVTGAVLDVDGGFVG